LSGERIANREKMSECPALGLGSSVLRHLSALSVGSCGTLQYALCLIGSAIRIKLAIRRRDGGIRGGKIEVGELDREGVK
jgi:hypothetical protein